MKITLKIPASSANLGAGFDCLSLGLGIFNIFRITTHTKDMQFTYSDSSVTFKRNLMEEAYKINCHRYNTECVSFHSFCEMGVPYSFGLGSSANSIVAGVVLSRILHNKNCDRDLIFNDASAIENHLDNLAGCIFGGFNISFKDGKKAKNVCIPVKQPFACLLLLFDKRTETDLNRQKLPKSYPMENIVFNLSRSALLAASFASGDFTMLRYGVNDSLHQPYRLPKDIEINKLKEKLAVLSDYYGFALSGSGPTIIIYCKQVSPKIEEIINEHFVRLGKEISLQKTTVDNQGLQIINTTDDS